MMRVKININSGLTDHILNVACFDTNVTIIEMVEDDTDSNGNQPQE